MLRGDVGNSTKSNAKSVCVNATGGVTGPTTTVFTVLHKYCTTPLKTEFYTKVTETVLNDNAAQFRIANRLHGQKCENSLPNDTGGAAILADRFPESHRQHDRQPNPRAIIECI